MSGAIVSKLLDLAIVLFDRWADAQIAKARPGAREPLQVLEDRLVAWLKSDAGKAALTFLRREVIGKALARALPNDPDTRYYG